MCTLLLLDAHGLIHRAYHALPLLTNTQGQPTNAMHGFLIMFARIIDNHHPTHIIACFDTPTPSFRKALLETYQSQRPPMIEELKAQIQPIKELLDAGGIMRIEEPGYEADDIIGTIVEQENNTNIEILTADKDILQLVNDHVSVLSPKMGISKMIVYDKQKVRDTLGVSPEQIPDYKALMGDASDNYHGAKGIGPKTAVDLINHFGTIDNMFANLTTYPKERVRSLIQQSEESIRMSKQLATIVRTVEVDYALENAVFRGFNPALRDSLDCYGLKSVATKFFGRQDGRALDEPMTSSGQKTPQKDSKQDQMGLF